MAAAAKSRKGVAAARAAARGRRDQRRARAARRASSSPSGAPGPGPKSSLDQGPPERAPARWPAAPTKPLKFFGQATRCLRPAAPGLPLAQAIAQGRSPPGVSDEHRAAQEAEVSCTRPAELGPAPAFNRPSTRPAVCARDDCVFAAAAQAAGQQHLPCPARSRSRRWPPACGATRRAQGRARIRPPGRALFQAEAQGAAPALGWLRNILDEIAWQARAAAWGVFDLAPGQAAPGRQGGGPANQRLAEGVPPFAANAARVAARSQGP